MTRHSRLILNKVARENLKKGPRMRGVRRPIPYGIFRKRNERNRRHRYEKKWAKKIANWWRDLMPDELQPEKRLQRPASLSEEKIDFLHKKKVGGIAGLKIHEHWYSDLASYAGYSIDLVEYVYRKRPADFEGFAKYFLLKCSRVVCIEDVAELGELYQFLEKNFYLEMRSEDYAVRVHTAWLQVVGRHAMLAPHKFYGGNSAPYSQLGLNMDGSLLDGLFDKKNTVEDVHTIAQVTERVNKATEILRVRFSEDDVIRCQKGTGEMASPHDQKELNAFLELARYVSEFENKLASIEEGHKRAAMPQFATYLLVKKAYEEFRPLYQWHPLCASRSTDFVQNMLPTAGDPIRIFNQYFISRESKARHGTQLLTPSSHTYEGFLLCLLASNKLKTFVDHSRNYQDHEIHGRALQKFYKKKDWVMGQRFIVRNYKCKIDDLTMRENSLEPRVQDLVYMISIFSKNGKRQSAWALSEQLLERIESHPADVVDCHMPMAELKDFTKVRDRQLFSQIYKAHRAIKEKQRELETNVRVATGVRAREDVLKGLQAISREKQHLASREHKERYSLRRRSSLHPKFRLVTKRQRALKQLRQKRREEYLKRGKKSHEMAPNPYKNFFKNMSEKQFQEYMKNQEAVLNKHGSQLIDHL